MNTLPTPLAVHCSDFDAVAAIWRMLDHVPDDQFQPMDLVLNGEPLYTVVRDPETGMQTSAGRCSA